MSVKLVECPRDAMQGFHRNIPTEKKIEYLNALLSVGFSAIDCGSFVSAKAVPQLADTAEVLNEIDPIRNSTKLLTIVANERGAEKACEFDNVSILGFPFSISETFQIRNTNQTIEEAVSTLQNIAKIANDGNKELLVYLSMGFGNPFDDHWSPELAIEWCKKLSDFGISFINLSDTIGGAEEKDVRTIVRDCIDGLKHIEFGAHFHTRPDNYHQNISAAYENGCRKFDAAIMGFGGCPFASDTLTGNLPTELLMAYVKELNEKSGINEKAFEHAMQIASTVFI